MALLDLNNTHIFYVALMMPVSWNSKQLPTRVTDYKKNLPKPFGLMEGLPTAEELLAWKLGK